MLPSWVPAVETKPALGQLLLVQSFVNTVEFDTGEDLLQDQVLGDSWLRDSGLLRDGPGLTEAELERTRLIREALRSLMVFNALHGEPPPQTVSFLREALRSVSLQMSIGVGGDHSVTLEPGGGDPTGVILSRLLVIVRDAQRDGTWARLKACSSSECRWAYYDRSHSRNGRWCDMAGCGNRNKNRALRARKAGPSPTQPKGPGSGPPL